MTSEEWKKKRLNNFKRNLRLKSQQRQNACKPPLVSEDVLETGDFVFSPIKPSNRVGDSGNLLLAKRKTDRREQYLVKHEYCDCAANEFVYTKMVRAMGFSMPEAKLFHISDGEKRNYFSTGYTLAAKYLNLCDDGPTYETIRERALNWTDYFSFISLYDLFTESDSFEVVLADDNRIYRVDTTASFIWNNYILSMAGIDEELGGINPQKSVMEQIKGCYGRNFWYYIDFNQRASQIRERYGNDGREGYLKSFIQIQQVPDSYIDDFLNTLCYFYPDFVGDYFKHFIKAAQKISEEFIKSLE